MSAGIQPKPNNAGAASPKERWQSHVGITVKASISEFHRLRGLRYHVRRWGEPSAPKLFFLHGWMDVSASFQFVVDALARDWCVMAPDWRGFGETEWAAGDYLFADYLADLEALLDLVAPGEQVRLVGHSLGGNVACLYAGVRPERVRGVVSLEGFGLARSDPNDAALRYARWLDEQRETPSLSTYPSFDRVAWRLRKNDPRLTDDRAWFVARHWGRQIASGEVQLRADPKHKLKFAISYRLDETLAIWRRVRAPVLWVEGGESAIRAWLKEGPAEFAARMEAFQSVRHVVVPDAGHMLHHDTPEQVAALIERFLARQ